MFKKICIILVLCFTLQGCAGIIHLKNKKGVDARAKASEIKTPKGNIEDAKGKLAYGSTFEMWIYWPWKIKVPAEEVVEE